MDKYISINELDTFDFHDSIFKNIENCHSNMTWELEHVNVTIDNSQNKLDTDMEAGRLYLIFSYCSITRIEYYGCKTYSKEGKLMDEQPSRFAPKEDYQEIFEGLVNNRGVIIGLEDNKPKYCSFEIITPYEGITVGIEYSEVKAEWDIFKQKSYYLK
jgi:hypothetical protein